MADPARLAAAAEATAASDAPTEDLPVAGRPPPPKPQETQSGVSRPAPEHGSSITRLFGSRLYFRLWLAQFTSSLGDWIGFVAITAISNRIAGTNGVALVLSARLVPGFFLGSVGGLLADRLDRKKVMVACDIGRGVVIGLLPFVQTLPLLFLINLVLEALTLLWTPAKEATVPNIVREEQLPRVNSLGLAAAYGTFPLGAALFTALAAVAAYLGRFDALSALRVNQENLAIWMDTGTYLISALLISTLAIPGRGRQAPRGKVDLGQGLRDVREGWTFIRHNAVVRSVMLALSCGLVGGGMVVPLGPDFASDVLGGGPRAFGALITAMGVGVAVGVIGVGSVQSRLRPERVFVQAVLLAGVCLIAAASTWALTPALLFVAVLGVGGGAVYVFGFSLVQSHTDDELRGRIFSALYASVRLCLVLSFVLGPLLASLLNRVARRLLDNEIGIGGWHVALPGSRLALWLAGAIILGAGFLARRSLRAEGPRHTHPS
ncbi:MAG TPA: MFS transporter, partial [Acidimicrobiales bacterium]|nr:MFS transporter [Acidimicrobiales bacterium]